MFQRLPGIYKSIWKRAVNRETITYGIAGALTTLVNYAAYYIFCNRIGIENLIANIIAWIIAVIFAYIINDIWVFKAQMSGIQSEFIKVIKFFGARLFSLIVEEAGLFLFVDILSWNNLVVKAALAVIVIILNYFFSKLYIFNKRSIEI
ncbi:GtrA family protein [Anaerocolumna sedimenticola]|uniref:GtrA family protein n=1 Tax=Anaerocolumna sedimenticola TaxID=2696063 RepID=A0A6P1TNB9_9FIRM|nr:GtrA family protein [Anaerocolumna sedimenticola]QHQ61963.1 GtrA family protein [Anaerocolumna sedimenticola]